MKIKSEELISDLIERTRQSINKAEQLKQQSFEVLNQKPAQDSWSILECIEHLNMYGYFYMPEIERSISEGVSKPDVDFRSGWLGNYFAKSMLPKEKLNKMKTFKDKNPNGSILELSVLDTFLDQQHQTLKLLDKARNVSLTKTKTAISISKLLKLRLGDTFRVVIYHNQRHLVQAEHVLVKMGNKKKKSVNIG